AVDAVARVAEDDLRDRAPEVCERGPGLVVAHRRLRLPHQHRLVEPATEQIAAELAHQRGVEAKKLLAGGSPRERTLAVADEAVHRDAHRVDQHDPGWSHRRIAPCRSRSGTSRGTWRISGPTSTVRRISSSARRPWRSS